jgi:hypothetical protein
LSAAYYRADESENEENRLRRQVEVLIIEKSKPDELEIDKLKNTLNIP